jgi:hypothetical protein
MGNKADRQKPTYSNLIQFRMICVCIIFVEKFFPHRESGLDAQFVVVVTSGSGKVSVDVIHRWDHLCKVGC